jgi:hypothetical protein
MLDAFRRQAFCGGQDGGGVSEEGVSGERGKALDVDSPLQAERSSGELLMGLGAHTGAPLRVSRGATSNIGLDAPAIM